MWSRGLWLFCLAHAALSIPVYVMLPLDTVNVDGTLSNPQGLQDTFNKLKSIEADGVMVDVWWGVVERLEPMSYNWGAYQQIIDMAHNTGLRVQVVMSFHQCGGNVGDNCNISLPLWVLDAGKNNSGIFYRDAEGHINREYLSLGVDQVEVLAGRSPVTVYADYVQSFLRTFQDYFGSTIVEIEVGLGPAGELRYPSYPSAYWSFPGIGEFQCYDPYMLAQLKTAAANAGHPEWGLAGPNNAGTYNNRPSDTGFFRDGGSFSSDYGKFFLNWYSSMLIAHGDRVLGAIRTIMSGVPSLRDADVKLSAKVAGIHWWYDTSSHAAELTAGYYNIYGIDGYQKIAAMLASHQVGLDFTMLEMTDGDNSGCNCGSAPEELVKQTFNDAITTNISFSGENALPRYDEAAYQHILSVSQLNGHKLASFTYLRWSSTLTQADNWRAFSSFVSSMHGLSSALSLRQHLLQNTIAPHHSTHVWAPRHQHSALIPSATRS